MALPPAHPLPPVGTGYPTVVALQLLQGGCDQKEFSGGKKCVDCPVTKELQSIQMEDLRYSQMERPGDVQLVARPFQHVLHPCSHEQVGYKQVRGSSTW